MKQLIITILLVLIASMFVQNAMADTTWFITKWQTTAASETITIPTNSSYTYSYDIDCDNDGTFEQIGIIGDGIRSYVTAGEQIINIQGTLPAIYFNNTGDKADSLTKQS